ncbi:phospholipase D-like domain-containing protein [Comamonas faecalis]|uniref:Phospholipase D-like domain-containing protein n=1 Tax=Comamonas faecalis TaxID=1387849 RepID=A0ABP7QHS7_9BURK
MIRWIVLSGLGHAIVVALGLLLYVLGTRIGHQRRHPSAALGWVLGMLTLPYLTIPLFLFFGSRKLVRPRHRAPVPAHHPVAGAPAWATQLLAGLELPPAQPNVRIALHEDGGQALAGLLATIDGAVHQLDVCTYVLASDATGRQVAQALAAAAARGVQVHLLIDAMGSLLVGRRLLRELRAAGVHVRRFMPLLHNPLHGRTNLRNHRKLVVADGRRLWSGGRNLACEYFVDRPNRPAWVDLSFEIDGPVARQAHVQFLTDWRTARGLMLRRMRRVDQLPDAGAPRTGALAQWLPSGPDHADDTLHALLLAGAWHAQRRIWLVTPYFVPDDALLDAWCLACRRGVDLQLVLPRRSNHRLADMARERALRQLASAGARVWLSPAMVHAKAVLIDDQLALCGSLNLDARSLFLNYEAMTAFYGPAQVGWLAGWIDALRTGAQPYEARRPSWSRDIAEGVVRAVGFQL